MKIHNLFRPSIGIFLLILFVLFSSTIHAQDDKTISPKKLLRAKNYQKEGIPVGAKILKINGITVDSFINKISPYISYETENFRNTIIDGSFEQYLYVAFGFPEHITIDYFSTEQQRSVVKNMDYKEWKTFQKDHREERESKIIMREPYAYENTGKGVGLLHIYSFGVSDFDAYESFLAKTFKSIQEDSIHSGTGLFLDCC